MHVRTWPHDVLSRCWVGHMVYTYMYMHFATSDTLPCMMYMYMIYAIYAIDLYLLYMHNLGFRLNYTYMYMHIQCASAERFFLYKTNIQIRPAQHLRVLTKAGTICHFTEQLFHCCKIFVCTCTIQSKIWYSKILAKSLFQTNWQLIIGERRWKTYAITTRRKLVARRVVADGHTITKFTNTFPCQNFAPYIHFWFKCILQRKSHLIWNHIIDFHS